MNAQVVFWDVDTQHDFMDEDGSLAVPGGSGPNSASVECKAPL